MPLLHAGSAVKRADRYEFQLAADATFRVDRLGKGTAVSDAQHRGDDRQVAAPTAPTSGACGRSTARDKAGRWSHGRSFTQGRPARARARRPRVTSADVPWPVHAAGAALDAGAARGTSTSVVDRHGSRRWRHPVIGTPSKPIETSGTVFAPASSRSPRARYFWAVDAASTPGRIRGARSAVGSFKWTWPTRRPPTRLQRPPATMPACLRSAALAWDPVPGRGALRGRGQLVRRLVAPARRSAARSRTTGTSLSPLRVSSRTTATTGGSGPSTPTATRAVWNVGPPFDKDFDHVVEPPTIPNLRLRDNLADPAVDLDPARRIGDRGPDRDAGTRCRARRATRSRSCLVLGGALRTGRAATRPRRRRCDGRHDRGDQLDAARAARGRPQRRLVSRHASHDPSHARPRDGWTYCARVPRRSDRDATNGHVVSDWTQLGGDGQRGFTYAAAAASPAPSRSRCRPTTMAPSGNGSTTPRLPLFTLAGRSRAPTATTSWSPRTPCSPTSSTSPSHVPAGVRAARSRRARGRTRTRRRPTTGPCCRPAATGAASTSTVPGQRPRAIPEALVRRRRCSRPPTGATSPLQPAFRWTPAEGARGVPPPGQPGPDLR